MKRILLFVVVWASLLSSCGDDEITRDPDSLGYQYYPLAVGNYWIYNVTENEYSRNKLEESTTYQSRERIDAIIEDQTGKEWYRVELSRRASANAGWVINGVKLISLSSSDLRVQENNQTVVQMVFPVKNGYSFVSNAFTNGGDPEQNAYYTYAQLGSVFSEAGKTYDKTLTVLQAETDTQIEYEQKFEVLASGIGPVNRTYKYRYFCDDSTGESCPYGEGYILTGSDKIEVLESSGKID
ncbi:hypothetical protein [Rufibacter sp. XAAS-G3-1]|uniref:hypothetical protein n=1 Tax=Rufibacter sp. XAAS-G3-1 TaxID=2729134 RepID=UPI0015E785C6|nr:hypothetical protein [Rufibacter sp. XAAS-G3-1]